MGGYNNSKSLKEVRNNQAKQYSKRLHEFQQTVDKKAEIQEKTTMTGKTSKKVAGVAGQIRYKGYEDLSASEIRDLVIKDMWTTIAVNAIVDEVISNKLVTTDPKINAFLKYPSVTQTLTMIRKQALKDMLKYGNGGIAIEYKNSNPTNLVVVPGYTIRVTDTNTYQFADIANPDGEKLKQVERGDELVNLELSQREFMHLCFDKDSDSLLGRAITPAIYDTMNCNTDLYKGMSNQLKSGLYKPFLVGADLTAADMNEFIEFINYSIVNSSKAIGVNTKDIEFNALPVWDNKEILDTMQWLGQVVATAYKVPPFVMGLISGVGSMNAREQMDKFRDTVIAPILEYEAHLYTMILVRNGFKDMETEITSSVLGNNLNYTRAKLADMLYNKGEGVMTKDEVRTDILGLEALDEIVE